MKDCNGKELTKDEEIVVLRRCIEELKTELFRMRGVYIENVKKQRNEKDL